MTYADGNTCPSLQYAMPQPVLNRHGTIRIWQITQSRLYKPRYPWPPSLSWLVNMEFKSLNWFQTYFQYVLENSDSLSGFEG
jgi:hypothetical protein